MADLTTSDWIKGITLSLLSTFFGAASKLAIRKSWLMEAAIATENNSDGDDLPDVIPEEPDSRLPEDVQRDENAIRRKAKCVRLGGFAGMTILNPLCG